MFEKFVLEYVDVGAATLRVRHGGAGYPVLLLHGHPRTHTTWHRVAPLLAGDYSVVCPDLRGYGQSSKPPSTADHEPYSKRAMARDCLALMRSLGHERFAVAGHDRGGYVALRLACERLIADGLLEAVPLNDSIAAVSVGMVDGVALLDLDYPEDSTAVVDANVVMTGDDGLVEVQATAERMPLSRASLDELLSLAAKGIAELRVAQEVAIAAGVA